MMFVLTLKPEVLWTLLMLFQIVDKFEWYNKFLAFVLSQDELLLKKYALLPNMNGTFLKKDKEGFKQGEGGYQV